jgi:transposase-like protein
MAGISNPAIKENDKTDATRIRRQYSAGEKVRLLRLHLVEGQPISAICDQHQSHPTLSTSG